MFIRGFYTQANMARFLCKKERDISFKQFRAELRQAEELDPENFSVTDIILAKQEYLFVSSEHAFKRMRIRGAFDRYATIERCIELLQKTSLTSLVSIYRVFMDDDGQIVENVAGYSTFAIIDVVNDMVYILQAGYQFVRLVTLWNLKDGMFMAKPFTKVVEFRPGLTKEGFMEVRHEQMSNVIFLQEDIRKHPHKGKGGR